MAKFTVTESKLVVPATGSEVATALMEPGDPIALMMLGHGAGTPMHSPLMVQMAEALAEQRIATFRYNYPYSENTATYSPGKTDSLEVLLSTATAAKSAAADLSLDLPLFLGGRSMSSQVLSLALTRECWPDVRGAVLYVFPTRWLNVLENPVSHLHRVPVPMLFVQGARDTEITDLSELQSAMDGLSNPATLHVVEAADHFFDPPEESSTTRSDVLSEVSSVTASWIRGRLPQETFA